MMTIFRILVTVATATLIKGSFDCDFSRSFKTQQLCFGELGQPLIFHLSNTTNTDVRLKKDGRHLIIERDSNGKVMRHWETDEFEYLGRGIVKLNNSTKNHSGDYMMEEFQSDGVCVREVKVYVKILAPVSKPALSQLCWSEQAEVNCSSLGDEVKFILAFDGQPVVQTQGRSRSLSNWTSETPNISSVSIMLDRLLTGNITCQAWNDVSKEESVIHLNPCKDVTTSFRIVVVAVIAAVTLLLAVAWTLCMKCLYRKARPVTAVSCPSEEDIVYSEVRMLNRKR